jgi:hypothetical protein
MPAEKRFPAAVLAAVRDGKYFGIRAGRAPHRFIGVWAVLVEDRVFVRSWTLKPRSWWRTFLTDPEGALQVPGRARALLVRAVQTRSERLRDAVDRAYLEKYNTKGSLKYSRGFKSQRRRATTTELLPL